MKQCTIRDIEPSDNPAVAQLIRTVMTEYGAVGPGFSSSDPEVDHMAEFSRQPGTQYFVLVCGAKIVGGGGYAPLKKAAADVCELQKMYLYAEVRGKGLGKRLAQHILRAAADFGYRTCYIETMVTMSAAQSLYKHLGFYEVPEALGATGHCRCDRYLVKSL